MFVLPSEGCIRERSLEPPWSPSENAQMDSSNSTQWEVLLWYTLSAGSPPKRNLVNL